MMSLVDPSPSAAMSRARRSHTSRIAAEIAGYALESTSISSHFAAPVARRKQESFVDVSESTVTLLKVALTAAPRAKRAASAVSGASVAMTASMVAILG